MENELIVREDQRISRETLRDAIAYAGALDTFETKRKFNSQLDSLLEGSPIEEDESISLLQAYKFGDDLSIPREYLDKALLRYSLSNQQKQLDVEEVNSYQSLISILRKYNRVILNRLSEELPLMSFESELDSIPPIDLKIFQIIPSKIGKGIFSRKKTIVKDLFKYRFMSDGKSVEVNLYDPITFHICKNDLKVLEEKFKKFHGSLKYTHHYDTF